MLLIILFGLFVVLLVIYGVLQKKYNYWKNKDVPHLPPTLLLGNYGDFILLKKYQGLVAQKLCQAFPNEPYVGAYFGTEPALIIQDPELIKLITTKDFYYFNSREIMQHSDKEVIGKTLFFTHGDRWKVMRQHMTPIFTTSKMKSMFYLIEKCTHKFEEMLEKEVAMSNVVDITSLTGRYTIDCICTCGFGVDTATMKESAETNEFNKIGKLIFENSNVRGWALIARSLYPSLFYGLGLQAFPDAIGNFFHSLATDVFKSRNYKPTSRNDFIDMILNLKKNEYLTCDSLSNMKTNEKNKVNLKVDDEFLVAQCIVFFGAGFETSATSMGFTLYELAKDQEAQRRAYEEVDEYLHKRNGKIEYDCVTELPYLNACHDEAIRLYPVLSVVNREVVEDYTLPTGVRLEKGMRIQLPVYHMHRNPEYFPEPDQFRPERFLPENKNSIKPYVYMPFGEGPRICIGMRFAKMQSLPGLATVLRRYRVEVTEGTPRELDLDPRAIVTQSKHPIILKLVPREQR